MDENPGDMLLIFTSEHSKSRGEKLNLAFDVSNMFDQLNDFVARSFADRVLTFVFCKVDAFRMLLFTDTELFIVVLC